MKLTTADRVKWAALILVVGIFLVGIPKLFAIIDCNTATRNLAFMNECIEMDNCTLNARDMAQFKAFTRLQILRCD